MTFSLKRASQRGISLFTFNVKAIAGRRRCFLICCLRETGLAQAAIGFEDVAALAADRFRAEGGKLVASVWLIEGAEGDPETAQAVDDLKKMTFAGDAKDDQMGMRKISGKKRLCHLDGCMAGLDNYLRGGEVRPHEKVDIRGVVLRELHGFSFQEKQTSTNFTVLAWPSKARP